MSTIDQAPRDIYSRHRRTPKAPEYAVYTPVASYEQMLDFLVKVRSILAKPSLDNMNYIFANQEPLHDVQVLIKRLSECSKNAALACTEARKNSEEVARRFQQAWDLVDIKVNAFATQSRYANTVSQEMGEIWRIHNSPPNKNWGMVCLSLAFELKGAVQTRQQMRRDLEDVENRAEKWEGWYIGAVHAWRNTHEDVMQLQEAFTAMRTEFLAGAFLAERFMQEMREVRDRINDASERERVRRINRALKREEEGDTEKHRTTSRSKKHFRDP